LIFSGSERVWTATASEQPTGHSGLTPKAEEKGFKVSRFQDLVLYCYAIGAMTILDDSATIEKYRTTIRIKQPKV